MHIVFNFFWVLETMLMQIFGRETRLIMGKVKVANLSTCNLLLSSFIVLKTPTSDYEIIL